MTLSCKEDSSIHFFISASNFVKEKNKCSLSLITGGFLEKIDRGFINSVASYFAPQTSQLSPY
jgi:hypothetical protein